ncbi:transposase [Enterococcus sp. LJL99]
MDASFNIFNEIIAIDATAINAHSKSTKTENPKLPSVENQRTLSKKELNTVIPHYPSWGVKKNSQGKNNYWFSYKGHYAVTTKTHYLVSAVTTSAFVSDMSIAIPLLRNLSELNIQQTFVLMDKGYDAKAIYEEAHACTFEPIIDLKKAKKNNGEVDRYFTPTCLLEHSYSYDSFDFRYGALKFVRPEQHCRGCPLKNEGLCQKVMKIKQTTNVRNYSHPARGTKSWKKIYAERTAVERVNSYLKRSYQLNDTTYYKAEQVVAEQRLIQLTYNLKTYANQRLNKKHREKELVA